MPGEKREVFLSRMLLLTLGLLRAQDGTGGFAALHQAIADDIEANVRKGRARPQRHG